MNIIPAEKIRNDFPILQDEVYGRPLIYLDNAATTQKPLQVIDRIRDGYLHHNANVHRGVHFLSQEATDAHERARETVRKFIHARSSSEIIFTRGTTESINLVASSFGELLHDGDEVITTAMEHHSNIVPWQLLRQRKGIVLKVMPIDHEGNLKIEELESLLTPRTRLVTLTHVSNTLGTVNPVEEVIRIAHSHDIPVLIDGAQSVPHFAVDVQALDADFLAFSGHKIYGPAGIGVLYGKEKWLEKLPPYQGGGEMIDKVTFEQTTFNALPYKFEAGTPDFIGSTALASALDYVSGIGMNAIAEHERTLVAYATRRLQEIPGLRIYGQAPERSGLVSFLVGEIHPYDLGSILDKLGIAVRTGHHCAQPVMDYFGIEGTVRASFGLYNTPEDVDALVEGIVRAMKLFQR
ncbi:MAG: cysteine desulfurase [Paludibacteraceae bacterium]|nr:cysteine desulfurase [Paludibacteraceae bacterium]